MNRTERAVIVTASVLLLIAFVNILEQRGGPYFDRPATVVEHVSREKRNPRDALLLVPRVRPLLPDGAKVTCFKPLNGKWTLDIDSFHAAVALLPRQLVVPPFTAAEDIPKQDLAEYVIAVDDPLTNPFYRVIAEFPEGRLYKVQR